MTKGIFTRGSRKQARNRSDQEGSILIAASVFLLVGVILLGAIQIGYMYYTKRELQKTADLAALTGVQSLWRGCDEANGAKATAIATANQNFSGATITATCGAWNGDGQNAAGTTNALTVEASAPASPIVPFFKSGGTITAQAQAVTSPVAAFSVGSRLLSVNSHGLLAAILTSAGLSASSLNVLDSAGVATALIQPSGLLKALGLPVSVASGIGTPAELTRLANLTLGQVLDATATLVSQSDTVTANISAVQNVVGLITNLPALNSLPVKLFGDGGVLTLPVGANPIAALNAQLNALSLIAVSTIVANGTNFIDLGAGLPIGVDIQLKVLSPPSLAIGGVGVHTANSQAQLSLTLDRSLSLVGLGLARVRIPLQISVANSQGRLERVCQPDLGNDRAVISIGTSTFGISTEGLTVDILGGLLSVTSNANYEPQPSSYGAQPYPIFTAGELRTVDATNGIDIAGITEQLMTNILGNMRVSVIGIGLNLRTVTSALSEALTPLLNTVFGQILGTLFDQLGLQVGQTDVLLRSVQCASPRLVQ